MSDALGQGWLIALITSVILAIPAFLAAAVPFGKWVASRNRPADDEVPVLRQSLADMATELKEMQKERSFYEIKMDECLGKQRVLLHEMKALREREL